MIPRIIPGTNFRVQCDPSRISDIELLTHQVSVTLTDDDILQWANDVHFSCVPSPGENRISFPIEAKFIEGITIPDFPYTGMAEGDSIGIYWHNSDSGYTQATELLTDPNAPVGFFLAFGPYVFRSQPYTSYLTALDDITNSALVARYVPANPPAPLEGGGEENEVQINMLFTVFDRETGKLITPAESRWNPTTREFET